MKPTEDQVRETITKIQDRLKNQNIELNKNRPVKEGYTETINILVENRTTYDGIDKLTYQQARAIAVLAVDYLNGDCEQKVLVGVPIKVK